MIYPHDHIYEGFPMDHPLQYISMIMITYMFLTTLGYMMGAIDDRVNTTLKHADGMDMNSKCDVFCLFRAWSMALTLVSCNF